MNRTKLRDRKLPKYSKGEEIFNMTSHIVGVAFGIVATIMCIIVAAFHHNPLGIVSGAIYGTGLIVLYSMSSIYHGLSPKLLGKKVFQVIDHCTIFAFIASSYTPFCLCTLRNYDKKLGWIIFGIVWSMALLGILFNSIDLKKYKVFSMICYLVMGWCIIFKAPILPGLLTWPGFILLLSGGVVYTIGAVLYGIGKKHKYIHSIFHLAIVLASVLQFLCIILYVM